MTTNEILSIVYPVVSFLAAAIPAIIGWGKAIKNKRKAKTEEEKKLAQADMDDKLKSLIKEAEVFYKSLDIALKATGGTAGPYKKESVMNGLQEYANEKGYEFDKTVWSDKCDETVKLTKEVN